MTEKNSKGKCKGKSKCNDDNVSNGFGCVEVGWLFGGGYFGAEAAFG